MKLKIKNYDDFLNTRKSIVQKPSKKGLAKFGKGGLFVLPPLNTNIILTSLAAKQIPKARLARVEDLGVSFDLRNAFPGRIIVAGSRTNPETNQFQQYSCGCCWAYAIANSISDAFVVVNNYKTNPNLSWTFLLSCYPYLGGNFQNVPQGISPSAQCGGGNVASAMKWIESNGIATSVCVDYSWCINSQECTGQGGDPTQMNSQIPSCGCYEKGTFLKYKIKEVQNLCLACNSNEPSQDEIANFRTILKSHLKNTGPAIGCFHVFSNIIDKNPSTGTVGDFKTTKNPEGVYLECVGVNEVLKTILPTEDANRCQTVETTPKELSLLGAHAVAVIGWGEALVHKSLISSDLATQFASKTNPDMVVVPYWLIRNSWGDTFGENGFFKFAMYPFNKVSQIERAVQVQTKSGTQLAGGVAIFKPYTIVNESFSQNDQKGRTGSGTVSNDENPNIGFFEGNQTNQSPPSDNNVSPPSSTNNLNESRFLPQNDTIPPVYDGSSPGGDNTPPSLEPVTIKKQGQGSEGSLSKILIPLLIVFLLISLGVGGYYVYKNYIKPKLQQGKPLFGPLPFFQPKPVQITSGQIKKRYPTGQLPRPLPIGQTRPSQFNGQRKVLPNVPPGQIPRIPPRTIPQTSGLRPRPFQPIPYNPPIQSTSPRPMPPQPSEIRPVPRPFVQKKPYIAGPISIPVAPSRPLQIPKIPTPPPAL